MFLSANFMKSILQFSGVFILYVFIISCNQNANTPADNQKATKDSNISINKIVEPTAKIIPPLSAIPDSGKPYFKIMVYRNKEVLTQYEGDWAIPIQAGKLITIQFSASRQLSKIANFLVLYFNSPSHGSFPVVQSGNEKEKPTIIFTPETDGAYGIGISASSGTVNISKYTGAQISGSIEAVGKDTNGNEITIQAAFVNLDNNMTE